MCGTLDYLAPELILEQPYTVSEALTEDVTYSLCRMLSTGGGLGL